MGKLRTKIASLFFAVIMLLTLATSVSAAPVKPTGSGTAGDPYVIRSAANIEWYSTEVNGGATNVHAQLAADIDATGLNMTPIGTKDNPFKGTFDGKGHVIKNVKIDKPTSDNVGFFGYTAVGSIIKNLGLEKESVSGANFTGGLVGRSYSTIENCYTTGKVKASYNAFNIGSLVGNNHVSITDSYSEADVIGSISSNRVGGLVGQNAGTPTKDAVVSNSYAKGSVSGRGMVGGLIGENCKFAKVQDSSASGGVSGFEFVDDVIGRMVA